MGADGTSNITNVRLIKDTFMSMSTSTSGSVDLNYLKFFDSEDDADVLYNAPGTTTASTSHLYATTTILGNFLVATGTTIAPKALVVRGDYQNNGTFDANNGVFDIAGEWKSMGGYDLSTTVYDSSFSVAGQETTPVDVVFSTDGMKMFVLGDVGDDVNEYTLTTAYDVSTATFVDSFSINAQETTGSGLAFDVTGRYMYVVGNTSDQVFQYVLTAPWDVSTATITASTSVSAQDGLPEDVTFNRDGTKMFVVGDTNNAVYEYSLSTGFMVWTASFVRSYSIGAQETTPRGVEFSDDGDVMFLVGRNSDTVYSYQLATPYVLSTVSSLSLFSVAAQEVDPTGLAFDPRGTRMFTIGLTGDAVYEYHLEAPFALAPTTTAVRSVATQDTAPAGITFANGGSTMYVAGDTNDRVYQYSLATAYEVSSASFLASTSVASQDTSPVAVAFNATGSKMFVLGNANDDIYEYALSTPYLVSSASFTGSLSVNGFGSNETAMTGLAFSSDGSKLYTIGTGIASVQEWTLSMPFSISTASYSAQMSLAGESTPQGLTFSLDGSRMYVVGSTNDTVREYALASPFNVLSASLVNTFSIATEELTPTDIALSENGTKMFIVGSTGDDVNEYTLPEKFAPSDVTLGGTMTGTSAFDTLRFSNENAVATFIANASSSSFSIIGTSTTVTMPDRFSIAGDFYNQGILDSHEGTIYMTGADITVSGSTTGTSTFNHVVAQATPVRANDGVTWDAQTAPAGTDSITSVTYGNGLFVAVASGGSNYVITSPDGITWTARTPADGSTWRSVTYGNGLFVAVGLAGGFSGVMTSPDGITWTSRVSPEANQWYSVTYGNGLFVAVSIDGTNRVMTSPDGITWTGRTAASASNWRSVTYGNGFFVAVAYGGTNRVMTSPDGITWTTRTAADVNSSWYSVTYGNGLFVAVSVFGANRVMTSPDGITWTARNAAEANQWYSVTYGRGLFVAVAANGTNRVMTSPDGITWTARSAAEANGWQSVTYGNGRFVALSVDGTNHAMTSDSGPMRPGMVTFTGAASTSDLTLVGTTTNLVAPTTTLSIGGSLTNSGSNSYFTPNNGEVVFSGRSTSTVRLSGTFTGTTTDMHDVTVGGERAKNAGVWTSRSVGGNDDEWNGIAYGKGMFVAVGNSRSTGDSVAYSSDGVNWATTSAAGDNDVWNGVSYGNGIFVAVGSSTASSSDVVMTSPDGITWTPRSAAGNDDAWNSVTYGNGLFVAVACGVKGGQCNSASSDRVMTSPDGITWTRRSAAGNNDFWNSVTYANGLFVAVGTYTFILADGVMTSPDGITWTARSLSGLGTEYYYDVTYGNGLFVAVGLQGLTIRSVDGINWVQADTGDDNYYGVTYGDGLFVAVTDVSGDDVVFTSPDGITWTPQSGAAGDNDSWRDITYGEDLFVAVADAGGNLIMTSSSTANRTFRLNVTSNASTSDFTILSSSTVRNAAVLTVNGDYTNSSTLINTGTIYFGDSTTTPQGDEGFDIATSSVSTVFKMATSTTDTSMEGIAFNPSGTRMFMVGQGSDKVFSFDLGRPWDLSTASQTASTSVASQDTQPTDLAFNADGTRLFVIGAQNDKVYRYNLSSAYTISSLSFHSSTSVASQETQPTGLAFSTDGTILFVTGETGDKVYRYSLSYPFEVGTSTTFHSSTTVQTEDAFPQSVRFNYDGTRMFVLGASTTSEVSSYTLSMPYDVTTKTFEKHFLLNENADNDMTGLAFNLDGTRMFVTGTSSDTVFGYQLIDQIATGTATSASPLVNIAFAGDSVKKFMVNASTTNITVEASSTVILPRWLTIAGNLTQNGTWIAGAGTTTFASTTAQTISGTLTATSSLGNVVFSGSGTKTFSSNASTTNITIASSTPVVAPSHLTVQGNYANSGTFTAGSGTLYLSPTTTATTTHSGRATSTSAWNNVVVTGRETNDGAVWTTRSIAGNDDQWNAVTYGNGLFVAVSCGGLAACGTVGDRIATSPDGITWTARSALGNDDSLNAITYGNGLFVAVGDSTGTGDAVITSPDGITWTARSAAGDDDLWYGVTYGDGRFVAVGQASAGDRIMYSSDGITWATTTAPGTSGDDWLSVAYGNGRFVAMGNSAALSIVSSDGISWATSTTAGGVEYWRVTYGNGRFVAVSNIGTSFISSTDGLNWTTPIDNDGNWTGVTYGNGLFVAVSQSDGLMTSPDGLKWTLRSAAGDNDYWSGVAYGNGVFVVIGGWPQDRVLTSSSTSLFTTNTILSSNASTTNFTIASSSSTTAPSRLSIRGDYTNYGTFNANLGTTSFNGTTNQTATGTLSSTSSFYNLSIENTAATTTFGTTTTITNNFFSIPGTTIAFPAGATTTVANLILTGTSSNAIQLRSTTQGTQWKLNAAAQQSVTRVDVRDSDACPGIDISATESTDRGNNTCWIVSGYASGDSANQTFAVGQATTTIQTITITETPVPYTTAANDIRIAISTSTHNMRWDTTDTTAVFGGTASGKVSPTVTYEGSGSVLVVNVTSNFAGGDTLTISGVSFTQFASTTPPATALYYYYDGPADNNADGGDTGTIAITGRLTVGEHTLGQANNLFSFQNVTAEPLYRFKLTPVGEAVDIGTLTLALSGMYRVDDTDLANIALYRDMNGNGLVEGNDEQIGGAGALQINEQTGTITFSETWGATTTQDYVVIADTVGLKPGSRMNVSLNVTGTVTGQTSLASFTPTGSVSSLTHERGGMAGGNGGNPNLGDFGAVGGDAPDGQATTTGGTIGGGEEIGSTPGFQAPTANGSPNNEWTNGTNGIASDNVYATAASTNLRQSYSVFGFNVPSGNTVTGIEVKLEASGSTAAGTIQVGLSWNGDTTITATKATSILTGSDVVYTLGGPADTWGRSWTPTDFDNANFFVRVVSQPSSNTVRVDAIQVKPYHQAGGGGPGGGGGGEI
jgi:6-phosphogluconolactonase (cycloisomerase 2 family)